MRPIKSCRTRNDACIISSVWKGRPRLPQAGRFPSSCRISFRRLAALTQRTDRLLEKLQATSNALSRSLLKPQILEVQRETKELRGRIQNLSDASIEQLLQINAAWASNQAKQIEELSNLYFTFAYLSRWLAQLDEQL